MSDNWIQRNAFSLLILLLSLSVMIVFSVFFLNWFGFHTFEFWNPPPSTHKKSPVVIDRVTERATQWHRVCLSIFPETADVVNIKLANWSEVGYRIVAKRNTLLIRYHQRIQCSINWYYMIWLWGGRREFDAMRHHLETDMKQIPTLFTPKLLILSNGTRVLNILFYNDRLHRLSVRVWLNSNAVKRGRVNLKWKR